MMKEKIYSRFYISTIVLMLMLRASRLEDDTINGYLDKYPVEWYHSETVIFALLFILCAILLIKEVIKEYD